MELIGYIEYSTRILRRMEMYGHTYKIDPNNTFIMQAENNLDTFLINYSWDSLSLDNMNASDIKRLFNPFVNYFDAILNSNPNLVPLNSYNLENLYEISKKENATEEEKKLFAQTIAKEGVPSEVKELEDYINKKMNLILK